MRIARRRGAPRARRRARAPAPATITALLTELELAVWRVLEQARRIAGRSVEPRRPDLNMRRAQMRLRREIDAIDALERRRPGSRRPWRS